MSGLELVLTIVMWVALIAIALCLITLIISQVLYWRGHRLSRLTHESDKGPPE
jgi:hypothetical protein